MSRSHSARNKKIGVIASLHVADGSVSDIAPAGVAAAKPDRDQIARLAYSYWEARGCVGGSPEEDWYRAEQELQAAAGLAEGEPARLGTEE